MADLFDGYGATATKSAAAPPWDEMYLLPAMLKLIEGVEHGNYVESRQIILKQLQPALWKELSRGEQGLDETPVDRGF